jgi:dimethylargininase
MKTALLRSVSPHMGNCELTHLERQLIDIEKAKQQHEEYANALKELGCDLLWAQAAPELPDSVFVEDCAIVFDELAVITRPGALSRRAETAGVEEVLRQHRQLHHITEPGILDGGDVLVLGKEIFVGLSSRSNEQAVRQMETILSPHGYSVRGVNVNGCLHLKSAIAQVSEDILLLNPAMIDRQIFSHFKQLETHPKEPFAANALLVNDSLIYSMEFPRTALLLAEASLDLYLVDNSEVVKAEGGVTCCSVIFEK